ncbi:MAG: D-2-hydroxyacid dehydrogenase [Parabacteroides distasonis]|nr:D-2-hydroxyacid dehydrogenase [Parabacteroides distasonis]
MEIVVLDGYTLDLADAFKKELSVLGECRYYDRTSAEQVVERAQGAEVVFTNKVLLSEEVIAALPNLKYIGVLATGYNVVDIEAAKKRGIVVTNIPAYSTESVAQTVFAHLLTISNQVAHYSEEARTGVWTKCPDFSYTNTPLLGWNGKTMGIVGLGNIGQAVARIALAFGMKVIAYTSKKKEELPTGIFPVSKKELFQQSDVLSLHCPLTPDTKEFVCAETLSWMKPTAIVINTSRGLVVNEADLADALNEGKIMAAGVDVLSSEPPKADNPLLNARNCYITPHIAWATLEARTRLMQTAVDNLKSYRKGNVKNNVAV